MSQHDYNIANNPGATVRADINALAEAIGSLNGGSTAPSVSFPHMLWYDESTSVLRQRNTANTAWAQLLDWNGLTNKPTTIAGYGITDAFPTGGMIDYGGSTAPTGWLLCFGQPISRTTYAALFTAIGTRFGVGDGSTTFNVPDRRGTVSAGADNMGGVAAGRLTLAQAQGVNGSVVGAIGGEQGHVQTIAEMAQHDHPAGDNGRFSAAPGGTSAANLITTGAVKTGQTGGGGAHNNVQPTTVIGNVIIKI